MALRNNLLTAAGSAVLAIWLLFLPWNSYALGLGSLRVDSRIGEPLDLYIELLSAKPGDLQTLSAELASREDFRRIGVPYPEQAAKIRFQLEDNRGIRITSDGPVDAAYLHFLLAATWSGGKVVREYTALLDPPLYKGRPPAAKSLPEAASSNQAEAVSPPPAKENLVAPRPNSYAVANGDTVSGIVNRLRLDRDVSSHQAMMALYSANPGAFAGNINLLKRGATLVIPAAEEMRQLDPQAARAEFSDQVSRSQEQRRKPETVAVPANQLAEDNVPAKPADDQSAAPATEALEAPQSETVTEVVNPGNEDGQPQAPATEDRLRIGQVPANTTGSDDQSPPAESGSELQTLRSKVTELDESLVASRLENEELRQTIKGIEQQLAQLTRLLTVENQALALNQGLAAQVAEGGVIAEEIARSVSEAGAVVSMAEEKAAASGENLKNSDNEPASINQEIFDADDRSVVGSNTEIDPSAAEVTTTEAMSGPLAGLAPPPQAGAETAADSNTVESAQTINPGGEEAVDGRGKAATVSNDGAVADVAASDSTPASASNESAEMLRGETVSTEQFATPPLTTADGEADSNQIATPSVTDQQGVADRERENNSANTATAVEATVGDVAEQSAPDQSATIRSVADRGIVETLKEIPQIAVGSFKQLPETEQRIVGGAGALIAGLAALGLARRSRSRKQSPTRSEKSTQPKVIAPGRGRTSAASGGIMLSLDDEKLVEEKEEVVEETVSADPLAEAEAYIAYDHDDQAIRVLQDAWQRKPEQEFGLKLLELHHKHSDRRAFTALAEEMYLQIGGDSPAWPRIADMGRALNPESPLFVAATDGLATAASAASAVAEPANSQEGASIGLEEIGLDDLQPLQPMPDVAESRERRGESVLTLGEEIGNAEKGENSAGIESEDTEELGSETTFITNRMEGEPGADDGDELESALELAQAYLDLNDKETARGFVDEVLRGGTEQQKQVAAELARKLS